MTDRVLMIRPSWFAYDEETAESNAFQQRARGVSAVELIDRSREEFARLATALEEAGVRVVIAEDRPDVATPDSVFPNNWITFHSNGLAAVYPMATAHRRTEVRPELIDHVEASTGARWERRVDLTGLAEQGAFVEGTGSLVFDPRSGVAFACRSARTTETGLDAVEDALGVETHRFDAADAQGIAYYHTNVMMAVGDDLAIVCAESISDAERGVVMDRLRSPGREIIEIARDQVVCFAGNALMLRSYAGDPLVAMSEQARASFTPSQTRVIEKRARIVSADITMIERVGGGSARCMLAEIHAPG